jgi:hypothetical protein
MLASSYLPNAVRGCFDTGFLDTQIDNLGRDRRLLAGVWLGPVGIAKGPSQRHAAHAAGFSTRLPGSRPSAITILRL